jgi:7-cyano-7-deazaguanine synthase
MKTNHSHSDVVVLLSGGMDSTVLVYQLAAEGHKVAALSVFYGQRHKRELEFAAKTTKRLNLPHEVIDVSNIHHLLAGKHSSLTNPDVPVPQGLYDEQTMSRTIVPNRNAIMLAIASGWAVTLGARFVATAVHAGDHAVYPDCRPEFIEAMSYMEQIATDGDIVEVYAPFVRFDKATIAEHGHFLSVPFEDTWSCYEGGEVHCGRCGTCTERIEAFINAQVPDPTVYDTQGIYWAVTELRKAGKIK